MKTHRKAFKGTVIFAYQCDHERSVSFVIRSSARRMGDKTVILGDDGSMKFEL